MAALIVGHRQEGEGAGGIENLIGDILMMPLMAKRRDNRAVVVLPTRHADPRRFAHRRIAALRRDQQWRADVAPVLEADGNAMIFPVDRPWAGFPQQGDVLPRPGPRQQRRMEMPILVHPSQRLIVVAGIERQTARLQPVRDLDPADGAARNREMFADPDRVEHPFRRGGKRAGPAVETGVLACLRVGGIDQGAAQPAGVQCRRERQPDQPAAEDDYVASLHHLPTYSAQPSLGSLAPESSHRHN